MRLLEMVRSWAEAGYFEFVLAPNRPLLILGPASGLRPRATEVVPRAEEVEALRERTRSEAAGVGLRGPHLSVGEYRFRVTELETYEAPALVLRRVAHAPDLASYGWAGERLRAMLDDERGAYGLYLIVGRPASGKSGLLSAVQRHLLETGQAVYYIDEVMEFDLTGVGRSIAFLRVGRPRELLSGDGEAMKEVLRIAGLEDVFVGECRDDEDLRAVGRLARSGYRVWTTLHHDRPETAVERLRDLGMAGLLRALLRVGLYPSARSDREVAGVFGLYVFGPEDLSVEAVLGSGVDEAVRRHGRSFRYRKALAEAVREGRIDRTWLPEDLDVELEAAREY